MTNLPGMKYVAGYTVGFEEQYLLLVTIFGWKPPVAANEPRFKST